MEKESKTVDRYKQICTGCTACVFSCAKHAISMKENEYGFQNPVIDYEQCVNCGKCLQVCPLEKKSECRDKTVCYAAYNMSSDVRKKSTSGGIFYLLAHEIISRGGKVYGALYDNEYRVVHSSCSEVDGIYRFQGAKYSQSDLKNVFEQIKEDLIDHCMVLFSGTPCQVAGLKSYLGKEYTNLYTVDLVCHGVPSPKAWNEYIKYRQKQDGQSELPVAINQREKTTGWSRYSYSTEFIYPSGYKYSSLCDKDIYMKAFLNNMILRPSCGQCHFKGIERCSDFTLGDFWGVWDMYPELDDNKGVSLVITHSKKASEVFESVSSSCKVIRIAQEEAYRYNPSLMEASRIYPNSEDILASMDLDGFDGFNEQYELLQKAQNNIPKNNIFKINKRFISKLFKKFS